MMIKELTENMDPKDAKVAQERFLWAMLAIMGVVGIASSFSASATIAADDHSAPVIAPAHEVAVLANR